MVFNVMTCSGWANPGILGGCSQAWLALALMFFIVAIIRRQTDDGVLAGTPFFFPGALVGGIVIPLIILTLFGEARWGILAGVLGTIVGGFGSGFLGIGEGATG